MKQIFLGILFILPLLSVGQQWNKVPNTFLDQPYVAMIEEMNSMLFISGGFDSINTLEVNHVSSFDGVGWTILNNGLGSSAECSAFFNEKKYFGGGFAWVDGSSANRKLATWDGANWEGFGNQPVALTIKDLQEYNGSLYGVGSFTELFGVQDLNGIFRHDGTNFFEVDGGLLGAPVSVKKLVVYDSLLLVGGYFLQAGNIPVSNIAAWDGIQWSSYAGGVNYIINAMFVDTVNEYLYISGDFTQVGGTLPVNYFARWDGENWLDVGGGGDCLAVDFELYQNQLYAAGCFTEIGGDSITGIARFNGLDWDSLGIAYNPGANIMEVFQEELYVGGSYTQIGDTLAPGLAKWLYPLDSACKEMYAGIGIHPDTIYTGQLPYTFRSGSYGNSSLQWEFSDGYTNVNGHCAYDFNDTPGTYDIMLIAQCGVEADTVYSQVIIVSNASIEEKEPFDLNVYPNPFDGKISIEAEQLVGKEVQVSIYDLQGKRDYQKQLKFSSDTLQLALDLPKGSYQLELISEGKKVVQQIVVE